MYPLTAENLVSRVRRRCEDQLSRQFTDTQLLQIIDEQLASNIFTTARSVATEREVVRKVLTVATDFVPIDANSTGYTLPEYVADVRKVEGITANAVPGYDIPRAELDFRFQVQGPAWHYEGDRPGTLVLIRGSAFPTINLFYVRSYSPLHFGTAAAGAISTTFRFGTSVTGQVIERAGLYEGMDIVCTGSSPAGVGDQVRRITAYAGGSTRECTVNQPWTVTPTNATLYSLAVPIPGQELTALLIELCASQVFEELGELRPMPKLDALMRKLNIAIQQRGGPQRVWNWGP